jgi:hypothetical protein
LERRIEIDRQPVAMFPVLRSDACSRAGYPVDSSRCWPSVLRSWKADADLQPLFHAVADKMLVQGFHYPFPALAHVEKTASGYREVLMPWNPNI